MKKNRDHDDLFDKKFLRTLKLLRLNTRLRSGEGVGSRVARKSGGGSIEFFEHRPYTPGDRVGDIDWKLYSRTRDLFVKRFSPQEHLNVFILLDGSASMSAGTPPKFHTARQIAALLGFVALVSDDRLAVHVSGTGTPRIMAGIKGIHRFQHLMSFLKESRSRGTGSPLQELANTGAQASKHSHIFLVTDFLFEEDLFSRISALQGKYIDITLIHLFCTDEQEPQVSGPLSLKSAESGQQLPLHLTPEYLQEYRKEFRLFREELFQKASRAAVNLYSLSSDIPLESVVQRLSTGGEIRKR